MQFLLDSHSLLWALDNPERRLTKETIGVINDPDNVIYISMATVWELGIKSNIGKLKLPSDFFDQLTDIGYEILNITIPHLNNYVELPLYHRDPFDRILVSQAQVENLTIITADHQIPRYDVSTLRP